MNATAICRYCAWGREKRIRAAADNVEELKHEAALEVSTEALNPTD